MKTPRISDRRSLLRAYYRLINEYWKDEIETEKARTLGYLMKGCSDIEAKITIDELEEKLLELESQIKEME